MIKCVNVPEGEAVEAMVTCSTNEEVPAFHLRFAFKMSEDMQMEVFRHLDDLVRSVFVRPEFGLITAEGENCG